MHKDGRVAAAATGAPAEGWAPIRRWRTGALMLGGLLLALLVGSVSAQQQRDPKLVDLEPLLQKYGAMPQSASPPQAASRRPRRSASAGVVSGRARTQRGSRAHREAAVAPAPVVAAGRPSPTYAATDVQTPAAVMPASGTAAQSTRASTATGTASPAREASVPASPASAPRAMAPTPAAVASSRLPSAAAVPSVPVKAAAAASGASAAAPRPLTASQPSPANHASPAAATPARPSIGQRLGGVITWLMAFAFYYPLVMSLTWISGSLIYYLRWERKRPLRVSPPPLSSYPLVSLIVPCHNESAQVRETIGFLNRQRYPNFEIIAVNDGSRDDTGERLDALLAEIPRLRVIHFSSNQGKAMGLRMAALAAHGEFLICVDGDALLDEYATHWMVSHMLDGPRVGSVTGNPRIRNRSTLLGKLQVGEFSSIIGLIKRAQRIYGRVFTVSGVIACFRKSALHDVGYWSPDMITEDIDISWKLQMRHWDIRYEPNALCWILMPETLRGLWKQRLRWAQGGVEVITRYAADLLKWRLRRKWLVAVEYIFSLVWAYVMAGIIVLWALGKLMPLPPVLYIDTLLPQWHGVVLGLVCLVQFGISILIDRRYETRVGRNYYWMIWYPLAYWVLSTATSIVALPKTLLRRRSARATWVSPDRGVA